MHAFVHHPRSSNTDGVFQPWHLIAMHKALVEPNAADPENGRFKRTCKQTDKLALRNIQTFGGIRRMTRNQRRLPDSYGRGHGRCRGITENRKDPIKTEGG